MLGNAFYKMKDARAKQDIESQKHAMEQMKVYADMLQSQSALKLNQQKIKDLNQKTKQRQVSGAQTIRILFLKWERRRATLSDEY